MNIKALFSKNMIANPINFLKERNKKMAKILNPQAKEALNRLKMESASEVGVSLKQGYNGDLTSRENGSVGGQMVKKMIMDYENKTASK